MISIHTVSIHYKSRRILGFMCMTISNSTKLLNKMIDTRAERLHKLGSTLEKWRSIVTYL